MKFDSSTLSALVDFQDEEAMCDFGHALKFDMNPCTVVERMGNLKNYGVEFEDKNGEVKRRMLPISRIRRIV